jgi:probable F420-dependent oxidoreductase
VDLGPTGVWSSDVRTAEREQAIEAARLVESLGFGTLWIPGRGDDVFERALDLLDATDRLVVATGIVSIWTVTPADAAAGFQRVAERHPGRFLLGLGVSHAPFVDAEEPGRYRRPVALMERYFDELDAQPDPVPQAERAVAALGPRMLELARRRSAGSHPYLVSPEHTRYARELLGPDALLAPEQPVVLERDAAHARAVAREHLTTPYLGLPNYRNNWLRQGLTEDDLAGAGSDRLVDEVVAWGDAEAVAARVREHHAAGADHVCVQVLPRGTVLRDEWRELAAALG